MPKLVTVDSCKLNRIDKVGGVYRYKTKLGGHNYYPQGANQEQARTDLRAKVADRLAKLALENQDSKYDELLEEQKKKLLWYQMSGSKEGLMLCEMFINSLREHKKKKIPFVKFMETANYKLLMVDQKHYTNTQEWQSRLSAVAGKNITLVGDIVDSFITWKESQGVSRIKQYKTELATMVEVFGGAAMPIKGLNETFVSKFAQYLTNSPLAESTISIRWTTFRSFVQYCYSNRHIEEVPRNLKQYQFSISASNVESLTKEQIKTILGQVNDTERAWIIIMLNIGGTSIDVSSLLKSEVYLDQERIIRTRHKLQRRKLRKTKKQNPPPLINFPLWSETKRLIQKLWSSHPTNVLTRPNGELLNLPTGDHIAKHFYQQQKHHTVSFTTSLFRASASTILANSSFRQFGQQYLTHSPNSMMERHYITTGQADPLFDEAIIWLGRELGIHHT